MSVAYRKEWWPGGIRFPIAVARPPERLCSVGAPKVRPWCSLRSMDSWRPYMDWYRPVWGPRSSETRFDYLLVRLSVRPQSVLTRGDRGTALVRDDAKWDYFFLHCPAVLFFALLLRIGRVGYGCLDAACFTTSHQARLIAARSCWAWLYQADTRGIYLVFVIT